MLEIYQGTRYHKLTKQLLDSPPLAMKVTYYMTVLWLIVSGYIINLDKYLVWRYCLGINWQWMLNLYFFNCILLKTIYILSILSGILPFLVMCNQNSVSLTIHLNQNKIKSFTHVAGCLFVIVCFLFQCKISH